MRDIIFHGKRLDNGKWVEGSLALPNYPLSNDAEIFCEGCAWICSKLCELRVCDYDGNEISIGDFIPVDPSTVGQFTGLCDKNGVRIFEGDIVRHTDYRHNRRYEIAWNNSFTGYWYIRNDTFYSILTEGCEVIGNKWDNPELLEERNETYI